MAEQLEQEYRSGCRPAAQINLPLVVVRGGGDLGSGVAWRLYRCGFPVVILEQAQPTVIRRAVSFASAVFEESCTVEGVTARRAALEMVPALLARREIPVLIDPAGACLEQLHPPVMVDAILAKRNTGTRITDAALVVALGPGFQAGQDCHAVVETARGPWLGRLYWQGSALPDTGVPGEIMGVGRERLVQAPAAGAFHPLVQIGDSVEAGQPVAQAGGQVVAARIGGVVRGLLREGLSVHQGMKVGDIDPRGERACCFLVSDKALAVAGGVLEAILSWLCRGLEGAQGDEQ